MNRHLIQYIKDPGSAITHFIALVGAVVFSFPLIGKAVGTSNATAVAAMVIFISREGAAIPQAMASSMISTLPAASSVI